MVDPAQLFQLSFSITKILARAESPTQPLSAILRLLTAGLQASIGLLWRADYEQVELRNVDICSLGRDLGHFEAVSRARTFSIGLGFPGRIWAEKQAVFVEDLSRFPSFPRASALANAELKNAIGFPIMSARRVLGVYEFFSSRFEWDPATVLPVLNTFGEQVGIFLLRVEAEEQLTGLETEFRSLAEASVDPIVTIDEAGTILFVNAAFERVFGYSRAEAEGKNLSIVIPERMRAQHTAGLQRYLQTGTRNLSWDGVQLPALKRGGAEFQATISFAETKRGTQRVFSGYIRPL